jgi:hypothetical protein
MILNRIKIGRIDRMRHIGSFRVRGRGPEKSLRSDM